MGVSAETGAVGDLYCPLCERTFEEGERCPTDNSRLVRIAQQSEQLIGRDLDGRYTILEKLGQGGMGTVFRGTQHSVAGREVAIKVVTPSLVTEPVTIKRFLREATIASRLSHPNAVSVLDFGQTKDGLFYLVMELVTGRTLDTVVEKDGRLTPARIIRIGAQICDALEGAHQLQIIHRDLKPQNVIVLSTGRDLIKVLDFGLAKSLSKDMASATMTNAGALLGSPAFMPPEVVTGQTSDARADLYSLGCLLYFCAAGELPFQAATIHELIAMHASEPARRLTNVPLRLATVIDKLLAKSPDDRYPSAAATREALEESLGKTLSPSPMLAPPRAMAPPPPAAPARDDAPENDTSSSTVLGWDGISSAGKPGVPNRPVSTPASGPVRHSAASRTPTGDSPPLRPSSGPAAARTATPPAGVRATAPSSTKPVPADPRMITATPIDPRKGKALERASALPIDPSMKLGPRETPPTPQTASSDPRVDANLRSAPSDPRVAANPSPSPAASSDPRIGTNPAAQAYNPSTNPQGAPFDPRHGSNPASQAYNPSTNPQGAPFDPRHGSNPAAQPYNPAQSFDPRIGTNPAGAAYNPSTNPPGAPFDPRHGSNPAAQPYNPSTNPQGAFNASSNSQAPFDPRHGSNPAASPASAQSFDPRHGSNPAAAAFNPSTNPQGAPFDPRHGSNPAAQPYNPAPNPQGAPAFDPRIGTNPSAPAFDPRIGTNPAALPYSPHAPAHPVDPRMVTPPPQFAASSQPAMNPAAPHSQPGIPPSGAPKQRSTLLMVVIALLVVAVGGTIAFLAMRGI